MEQSLYLDYIQRYFPKVVTGIVEKLNGEQSPNLSYLHKRLLGKEYSVDGRWESLTGNYSRVSADVVAMDSALPLKKRDALSRASGDIPKLGMELYLNEKQMSDIDTMVARGMNIAEITAKIFNDTPRVITGVYERLESMFLLGLSTGSAIADSDNVGTGVRVDYGYLPDNQKNVSVLWATAASATPMADIEAVVEYADSVGVSITRAYADNVAINAMLQSAQMKQFFAFSLGFAGDSVPTPSLEQANTVLQSNFGFTIERVNRSVRTEIDGVQTSTKPWAEGRVVFTADEIVGTLLWTELAEVKHPVSGVTYESAEDYILVSKYRVNRPSLREYTTSQARVVPVITNVDRIFTLDTKTAAE